jgi:hypothetical protein
MNTKRKIIAMMILPHIAESNHGANPAARVRAKFINMASGDSEMTADARCVFGVGTQRAAQKTNPVTRQSQQAA